MSTRYRLCASLLLVNTLTLPISDIILVKRAYAEQSDVSMLNELVQGEISAVETYRQVLEKLGNEEGAAKLRVFYDDHVTTVAILKALVKLQDGAPKTSSGLWGTWAKTVVGSAKLLGDKTALRALKEGEEHGMKEYKELLENKNVPPTIKQAIQERIIPLQKEHVEGIDQLIRNAGKD